MRRYRLFIRSFHRNRSWVRNSIQYISIQSIFLELTRTSIETYRFSSRNIKHCSPHSLQNCKIRLKPSLNINHSEIYLLWIFSVWLRILQVSEREWETLRAGLYRIIDFLIFHRIRIYLPFSNDFENAMARER